MRQASTTSNWLGSFACDSGRERRALLAGAYGKAGCFTYVPPDGVVWKD
jgi:hypothetical protein